jgi:hypothetical protein
MVMIGRFSSDDPGWREPWDREPDRERDDPDWAGLDPRPRRRDDAKRPRSTGPERMETEATPETPQ